MLKLTSISVITLLLFSSCNNNNEKSTVTKKTSGSSVEKVDLSNPEIEEKFKIAYATGFKYAQATSELELDKKSQEYLLAGFKNFLEAKSEAKMKDINFYAQKTDQIVQENRKKKFIEMSTQGKDYVEKLINEESFKKDSSGLVYKVEKSGNKKANLLRTPFVELNYVAEKIDGKEFETTMRGNPRIIHQKGLLKAWRQALKIAGLNSTIKVVAPPELTYGQNGALPRVFPGEYIVYKINFFKSYKKHPNKL